MSSFHVLAFQEAQTSNNKDRKEFDCERTVARWDIRVENGANVGAGLFTLVGDIRGRETRRHIGIYGLGNN